MPRLALMNATIAAGLLATTALATASTPDADWPMLNRDPAATRYSPLDQIDRSNVGDLELAWSYSIRGFSTATPLVIDSVMYFPAGNRVVALDAATGKELWVHQIDAGVLSSGDRVSNRGVGYWAGDDAHDPRIIMLATKMLALDAATGQPAGDFGANGIIDVGIAYWGTPTISSHIAVIGANVLENPVGEPGNPRAFDLRTGEKLWEFQTVPRAGEPFNDSWQAGWEGRSGTNMWAFTATIDEELGLAYLPIGTPSPNYYGGDRPGANLFGNSLVAVDLETGVYRWHFQTIHHDIWDSDMPSAGTLVDVEQNGKRRRAIANIGKTSLFYVFDAETGEPLHEVEERWVPPGDVPGEYYHPTQPFPKTPPLSRMAMSYDDIVTPQDTTAEHAAACMKMWENAGGYINLGPFTPFMHHDPASGAPPRSTIQLPGGIGGVNWGGPAADPETGLVYVNALDTSLVGLVGWTEPVDPDIEYSFEADDTDQPYNRASVGGKGPFFTFSAPLSGEYDENGRAVGVNAPCYKPPWARLTAVDANTGEIRWAVPLGMYDELPEDRQVLGNAGSAGPSVTAGGLVFVGATNDRRFRAFDAADGQRLWEVEVPGNANANPMSYRGADGRQYVAINAGGTMVAYALPQ